MTLFQKIGGWQKIAIMGIYIYRYTIYLYIHLIYIYIYIYCVIHHISHIYRACLHILLHIFISKLIEKHKNTHPHVYKGTNCPPPQTDSLCNPQGLRHLRWYRSETGRRQPDMWRLREGMVREDDPFFIHDCCTKKYLAVEKQLNLGSSSYDSLIY